jgi:alcohol dehydrogenase (cytochrome c)
MKGPAHLSIDITQSRQGASGMRTSLVSAVYFACAIAGISDVSAQAQSADQIMINPPPKDWLLYAGNYNSQRHSALKQITTANVHNLAAKWAYHVEDVVTLETTPIVANGVMYVTGRNHIVALDARSGNIIWQAKGGAERGAAYYDGMIYVTTADRHIQALDARNGSVIWDIKTHDDARLAGGAPLVAHGKVMVSGNFPNGFIQAYDAKTGKYIWTWLPLPIPDDPAIKTWGSNGPKGMPIWVGGASDPEQNLVFYGTGQPEPEFAGETRPGDNLYGDSIVALDVDTGKLKWYFQTTPHDMHDWDATEATVLVDAVFEGHPRKLLLQANRNGFYYVLDRTNGQFLLGTPFIDKIDWTTGLDSKGRPSVVPGHEPTLLGTETCPSTAGATNWPSPTYDPDTHYFYLQATEGCGLNFRGSSEPDSDTGYLESSKDSEKWQAYVRALDGFTGKRVWQYKETGSNHYGPGLVSNGGGIVFAAEQMGQFTALDAKTGKVLWHFNTGAVITASPITYAVDGDEFVAIAAGTNVFAFALINSAEK